MLALLICVWKCFAGCQEEDSSAKAPGVGKGSRHEGFPHAACPALGCWARRVVIVSTKFRMWNWRISKNDAYRSGNTTTALSLKLLFLCVPVSFSFSLPLCFADALLLHVLGLFYSSNVPEIIAFTEEIPVLSIESSLFSRCNVQWDIMILNESEWLWNLISNAYV